MIDEKSLFDLSVKIKEEAYEKIIEMSKNNDYTTGNLLDFSYFKENYKLIATDLRKQIELEDPDLKQQISFIVKLEGQNNRATIRKNNFWIFKKFCKHHLKMETQNIMNLLSSSENEFPKFATKYGMLLTMKQLLIITRMKTQSNF